MVWSQIAMFPILSPRIYRNSCDICYNGYIKSEKLLVNFNPLGNSLTQYKDFILMNKKILKTTSAITTPSIIEKTVELAVDGWVKGNKKLIQVLREENKVWTDFLSPKNPECTSSQEYYDGMKVVIATGLGKLDLYNEDPKNNEPRNELVREITSKLKDLRKLLKPKAEKSDPRTPKQMFIDYINKAEALFDKVEDGLFGDTTEDVKEALADVIDLIR
mgnify:CR=1 FL=1